MRGKCGVEMRSTSVRMRHMSFAVVSYAAAVEFTGTGRQVGRPGPGGRAAMPWRNADTNRRKTWEAPARGFASGHVQFGVPAKRGAHMAGGRATTTPARADGWHWLGRLATPSIPS